MDERDSTRVAKASFDRCSANPGFLSDFYKRFFAICPEAQRFFVNTDFARQTKALRDAIGLLLIAPFLSGGEAKGPTLLSKVAERHSRRQLNIEPRFYPPFIESLLTTVKETDPDYSDAVDAAWRQAIAQGVSYMQSHY